MKNVGKKTYHFCLHHNNRAGAWVIHHPSKCDRRDIMKDKPATDKVMSQDVAGYPGRCWRLIIQSGQIGGMPNHCSALAYLLAMLSGV
jgi:hypothetical protein